MDLVDSIRDKRVSDEAYDDEEDFTVETNAEFNENSLDDSDEYPIVPNRQEKIEETIGAVDMRKPVETKTMSPEEAYVFF